MNNMNLFLDNKETLLGSEKKNWNWSLVPQIEGEFSSDDVDLDQDSHKTTKKKENSEKFLTVSDMPKLNEIHISDKETMNLYKNINISSQNSLLSSNTLSVVPDLSDGTCTRNANENVKQVQNEQLSNSEQNYPNDVYSYTGYFKVLH